MPLSHCRETPTALREKTGTGKNDSTAFVEPKIPGNRGDLDCVEGTNERRLTLASVLLRVRDTPDGGCP